jgi:hypothetical protein
MDTEQRHIQHASNNSQLEDLQLMRQRQHNKNEKLQQYGSDATWAYKHKCPTTMHINEGSYAYGLLHDQINGKHHVAHNLIYRATPNPRVPNPRGDSSKARVANLLVNLPGHASQVYPLGKAADLVCLGKTWLNLSCEPGESNSCNNLSQTYSVNLLDKPIWHTSGWYFLSGRPILRTPPANRLVLPLWHNPKANRICDALRRSQLAYLCLQITVADISGKLPQEINFPRIHCKSLCTSARETSKANASLPGDRTMFQLWETSDTNYFLRFV